MPTFRSYQQVSSVLPTDALVLDRIGVGTVYAEIENFSTSNDVLVPPAGLTMVTGAFYGVKTSLGAYTLNLPQLALQAIPAYLEVGDLDNHAGVNHITVNAAGGDLISDHGVTSGTYQIVISNIMVRFIANTSYWTAIPFGS